MDDDEFGDLYTDVLRPLSAQFQPHREESGAAATVGNALPIDLNFNIDDEEILYGTPDKKNQNQSLNPNPIPNLYSVPGWNLNAPAQEKNLAQPRGFDLNLGSNSEVEMVDGLVEKGVEGWRLEAHILEKGEGVKIPLKASGASHFLEDDDDDINIVLEDGEDKEVDSFRKEDNFGDKEDAAAQKKNIHSSANKSLVGEEICLEDTIPGLSGRLEDEWESEESEDDLQIVLNDNNNVAMAIDGMVDVVDEDGEPLVIVADNGDVGHHQVVKEEAVWGGDGGQEGDGDKDVGVASATMPPKTGYINPLFHHPFHSQFKYVRPGAAPLPAAAPGGMPAQVRPPISAGPLSGSGRGDWRPAGIKGAPGLQKGFHPGYGSPVSGANTAGRGYGSGLDFTLPSHKSIFEVDIDSFEDKPWKIPDIDVSDFFNFGLNENSWRDYCKQLEQLRLGKTMGRKICVYEGGRTEQDYDPEHAAAVGIQEIPSESADPGMADAGITDLERGSANERPSHPVGRPIPVDISVVERHPSADTRRPRFHDTDAIIEIVCSSMGHEMPEQDDGSARKDLGGGVETDYFPEDYKDDTDRFSPAHNGKKREAESRRAQLRNTVTVSGDEIVRENLHEERSAKGMGHGRLLMKTVGDNRSEHLTDDRNGESIHSGDAKLRSPTSSSSCTIESNGDQALVVENNMNNGSVIDTQCFSINCEREEMDVVLRARYTCEDGSLKYPKQKQKLSSPVEQLSEQDDDDDGEDSEDAKSSEIRKSKSGSGKDHRSLPEDVEDEVHQDRHCPPVIKKQVGHDDNARRKICYERDESGRHIMVARRKYSFCRKRGDANSSFHGHGKIESANWRKESDISDGSWHTRDEYHGSRSRVEDPRKREHGGDFGSRNWGKFRERKKSEKDEHPESRNQLDNGGWRGANRDHDDFGSRQRDRDNNLKNRNEKADDLYSKRRKVEAQKSREHPEKEDNSRNNRESSSRRKRDKDDGSDQLKRDDDLHSVRQKEGGSFQMERSERQRERDEWYRIKKDEVSSRREREEARPVMRNERVIENKSRISHSRGKDSYTGSNREYNPNVVARHGDQFKRRDRIENGCFSQLRGHEDTYARGNQLVNDDKKARYERRGNRDVRVAYGFYASRMTEHMLNEDGRKNKEPESGGRGSLIPTQRTRGGQISETVNSRDRVERQSVEVHAKVCESSRRMLKEEDEEEPSTEGDQNSPDLRKGRSKLERLTSYKEDFIPTTTSMPSQSRDIETETLVSIGGASLVISKPPEEKPSNKVGDEKDSGAETNNVNPKVSMEDNDKHSDTVDKLKKRSERFKLPMLSEKDTKRMESEPLPLGQQTDARSDSWIKSERPARKRRWIGK